MTKVEFMNELAGRLRHLPHEEYENAINYYLEYFDEAGEENEQKVIDELGSPQQIAAQIMADYAIKDMGNHPQNTKKGISTFWIVIASIFAMPIALPLTVLLGLCGVIVGLSVLIVFLALLVVGIALVGGGILSIGVGLAVVTSSIPTTMLFSGTGMVLIGFGIAFTKFIFFVGKKCFFGIAKFVYDKTSKNKGGALNETIY